MKGAEDGTESITKSTEGKFEKLDSLVEQGSRLATTLLQDTRLSLQRGTTGRHKNLLSRQSALEACKSIQERIRSYIRKHVPPSEVNIIELELTELMSRIAQAEKECVEADNRLLEQEKRRKAQAEEHALEVERLLKRLQDTVCYERKKAHVASRDLQQEILRVELDKLRLVSEAAKERSKWELEEERRRKKHREFLLSEASENMRVQVEAMRERSEESAYLEEKRFAERLASESARMRIEITASLQAKCE